MYLAGIDIGTTGCKCSVYDDEGNFFMEEYEEYRIHITKEEHTIDAEVVWEGIKSVIKKITRQIQSIEAICVTSFGEASVLQIQMGRKNVMKSQQRLAEIIFMRIQELHRERCTAYVSGVGRKDISRRFGKK